VRLALRFLVPLILVLSVFAWGAVPLVDTLMQHWFMRDLDMRSTLIANTVEEPLTAAIDANEQARISALFNRLIQDERLYAVGLCLPGQAEAIATFTFPKEIRCLALGSSLRAAERLLATAHGLVHLAVRDLDAANRPGSRLVLVHDLSFIERRGAETRQYLFAFFLALGTIVALITVVIAQVSWRGWVQGLRALLRGEGIVRPAARAPPELRPIEHDLRELIRDLERQYRPLDDSQRLWTPQSLRATLHGELRDADVITVSNREPYIHVRTDGAIRVQRPASGLVTALEPVMRACSGTWVAHGSGSADRDTVDANDRVAVPPHDPAYRLRRVWLSAEDEKGYYSGFANEGLWPLCHVAHVRPTFRSRDFDAYRRVNARFADAVVAEARGPDPVILVQDYHFALLPRMLRNRLPDATIITFWHIPWPNPEAYSICPWRHELLDGLLGSSILGFHTQFHCNNFLDTVDRLLESRVDRDTFTVTLRGERTQVQRYPISIEWPPAALAQVPDVENSRRIVRERHGLSRRHRLGVGIDRLDYTKGILERFNAIGRLLEIEPRWIGRFTFVQIAAPSRGMIDDYRDYANHVRELAAEINGRYPDAAAPPIVLLVEHHEPEAVFEYHRAADLCFVSSLHDGMNLVAKEFIAAHDDELGVLVLSHFAGAAHELPEALIVNPYDADQCAGALHLALTMPVAEQRSRMRIMRGIVREFNVYRWAGRMLVDAALMRQRSPYGTMSGFETKV
jgi:trehalose 6-phosphate synthase